MFLLTLLPPLLPLLSILLSLYFTHHLLRSIYNLTPFHPLSHIPGPRLAAFTLWYRTYFDVVRHGSLLTQLQYLHTIYGPVVRYGPNDVSFSSPDAYLTIFASTGPGREMRKDPFTYTCFGEDNSSFGYTDPHAAAGRRAVLAAVFSRRNVRVLEGRVAGQVSYLFSKIGGMVDATGGAGGGWSCEVDLSSAFRCMTLDIITAFLFGGNTPPLRAMDAPGFRHETLVAVEASLPMFWTFKHFPLVKHLVLGMPGWLSVLLAPETRGIVLLKQTLLDLRDKYLSEHPADTAEKDPMHDHDPDAIPPTQTIFHRLLHHPSSLLNSLTKPPPAPTKQSLYEESQALVIAGSDTVGNALSLATLHLAEAPPHVLERLLAELRPLMPRPDSPLPPFETLEKLPYLTAVIKETLRLSHGVVSSIPRIYAGSHTVLIDGVPIPPGTVVSASAVDVHLSPSIWGIDATSFRPERWLEGDERRERYLVPFSRGPRQCLGMQLAWCEMYLALAGWVRGWEVQLGKGCGSGTLRFGEFFVPCAEVGGWVRARVRRRTE